MCHPAIFNSASNLDDSIYSARVIEYQALKSMQLKDMQLVKRPA
jgi:hypothetical protein